MPYISDFIVDFLYRLNVRSFFGVPGHQTLPLYDAIYRRRNEVNHYLFHHEYAAGFAADAYSRVTNRIGVVDVTYGPGLAYLMPAIAEAYNASIPLLVITADTDLGIIYTKYERGNVSQGVDVLSLVKPITKRQIMLTNVNNVNEALKQAIVIALTGRPGPVLLDIPNDLFWKELSDGELSNLFIRSSYVNPLFAEYPPYRPTVSEYECQSLVKVLSNAKYPLIIAGGGVHISQAWYELKSFVEYLKVPIVTTLSGKGSIPEDHELYLGVIGSLGGWDSANKAIEMADLVIAIGTKLGQYATDNWNNLKGKRIVRIDIDPEEFERGFPEDLSLWGDVKSVLNVCLTYLKQQNMSFNFKWDLSMLNVLKGEWYSRVMKLSEEYIFIKVMVELNRIIAENDVIVTDASSSSGISAAFLNIKYSTDKPFRRFITPRGMAGLGYGVPGGIGAMIGCIEKFRDKCNRVIVVTGDGGFGYAISELETIKRLNIPLIIIVLNDQALGWIKVEQEKLLNGRIISSTFLSTNYAKIAEAFGIRSYVIEKPSEISNVLKEAYSIKEPVLVDVHGESYVPFKGLS